MVRRVSPVLFVMVALLAACQGTPALTDPAEIISQGLKATVDLKSFHVSLALNGTFSVPGSTGGSFNLDSTSLEADVDIPARNAHLTFAVPALLGLSGDVVVIGKDVWVKTSMTGTKWMHSSNQVPTGASPGESLSPDQMVDKVKEFLAKDGVVTTKMDDVDCGDRKCYQVSVSVPPGAIASNAPLASFDPSTVFGDALKVNMLFDREKLWLTEISTSIDSDKVGKFSATLTFSKFDEAITFSPPPSPDVTEGEITLPGM